MIKEITIGSRKIIIKGIGRAFYELGYPIGITTLTAIENGYEISWLHIADELLNEWSPKTVFSKLLGEIDNMIPTDERPNVKEIYNFCFSDYDTQRQMIYNYLWVDKEDINIFYKNIISPLISSR